MRREHALVIVPYGHEQITFKKAATTVTCHVCGTTLVKPKGGNAEIKGEVIEVYN